MELFKTPLVLLFALPGLALAASSLWLAARRRKALLRLLGDPELIGDLCPPETARRRKLKNLSRMAAIALLFIAWAGPQWGVELISGETMTNHVVIAVDTSFSMLARDVKPSRIENAKRMLHTLIDQLNNYRVGIVAFSGKAYIQCPITTDPDALKYFVSILGAGMLPEQGTNLSEAIFPSSHMLEKYPGNKAVILLTDGEDHSKELDQAVQAALDANVSVFTVGIGSPDGDLIPMETQSGSVEYKKDSSGKTVVTKLGEQELIDIAAKTHGAYLRYTDAEAVTANLYKALQDLGTTKWKSQAKNAYKNRYQWPLFLALFLLLIEFLIPEAGNSPLKIPGLDRQRK